MGFTHYFDRPNKQLRNISMAKRKKIVPIVQKIVSRYAAILTGDCNGETREPVILTLESDAICFNGIGDDSHETFFFPWVMDSESNNFDFCKTARKPYDDPVMEILIVLKHFIPGLKVRSDGFGTKDCPCRNPEINWIKAARRVRNLYGIVTTLFYWESYPAPGTKVKRGGNRVPVLAGTANDFAVAIEPFRRVIRRS